MSTPEKSSPEKLTQYPHGHHESVLRAHTQRTAANSAVYLLSSFQPYMHVLDIGCGPGTITADFAYLVPQGRVIGLDQAAEVLEQARVNAAGRGLTNIEFVFGDVNKLDYPDDTFDVVHAHQVLLYMTDPVQALREMRRVAKPGGIVAARDGVLSTVTWYPKIERLSEWRDLHVRMIRKSGGEPDAGHMLHAWAHKAGFERSAITCTASAWCFNTPEERAWYSRMWIDRTVSSSSAQTMLDGGLATKEDLESISQAWREWGAQEDSWFAMLHGEILCRV